MSMWIFGTNDIDNPILAIMGQQDNSSLTNAVANDTYASLSIVTSLPFPEMKLLYQIILQTRTSFGGTNYAKVQQVNDFRNVNNIQSSIITPSANYISSVDTGNFTVTSGELLFNYNIQNVGTGDSPTFVTVTQTGQANFQNGHLVSTSSSVGPMIFDAGPSGEFFWRMDTVLGVIGAYTQVMTLDASGNLVTTGTLSGTGYINSSPSAGSVNPWVGNNVSTRALGVVYHNTSGKNIMVYVTVSVTGSAGSGTNYVDLYIGSTSSPATLCGAFTNGTINQVSTLFVMVPSGWYYEMTSIGAASIVTWTEQVL